MTREEREAAIEYIKTYRKLDENLHNTAPKDSISYYATDKCLKYWDMVIQALEQQPCEDAVSREAVLKEFEKDTENLYGRIDKLPSVNPQPCDDAISREDAIRTLRADTLFVCTGDKMQAISDIEGLPSVTQKSGKWIDYSDEGYVECPFCGHATNCEDDIDELHYCFFCGAKMVEPQESEE